MEEKKYMSVEEAAELWNIPETKVWKWCLNNDRVARTNEFETSNYIYGIPTQLDITIVQEEIEKAEKAKREENAKKERVKFIAEENAKKEQEKRIAEERFESKLENVFYICGAIVVISFLISLFSCGVINSNDNYISDGYGNYSFSGSTFSGLQLFLFFVYIAMPFILYYIREGLCISPVKKIIIIIALTILTLVLIFPNMLEPGSSYSHGNFLGYRW